MKRFSQKYLGFSLVIALLLTGSLAWPRVTEAKGQCHQINTTLTSVADFSNFTTTGAVKSGLLQGTTKFVGDAASLTPITSVTKPPIQSQTVSYVGDLVITTNKGTLTTRSVGVFESVPFGRGVQFDHVTGGTGQFEGASGNLYFTLVVDSTGGTFNSIVSGEVCVK